MQADVKRTGAGHGNTAGVNCDEQPARTRKSLVWVTVGDTKIHSDRVLGMSRAGERKSTSDILC